MFDDSLSTIDSNFTMIDGGAGTDSVTFTANGGAGFDAVDLVNVFTDIEELDFTGVTHSGDGFDLNGTDVSPTVYSPIAASVANVVLYNRALTEDEIFTNYLSIRSRFE